jgi:cell wall-associated NlpC family hydrolase
VAGLALVAGLAYGGTVHAAEPARPGRVANTDGANLRVRAAPDPAAPVIKRLGPGWRLTVLGEPSRDGRWLRIEHGGTIGYVAVGYVAVVEEADPAAPVTPATVDTPRTGWVANTEGAALRLREAPELSAPVRKRLEPGWQVTVLGGQPGEPWLRVEHGGTSGYVAADYIAFEAPAATASSAPAPAPAPAAPRYGWVANTDGARLRIRTAPRVDAEVLKRVDPGWRVTIVEGPFTAADGSAWVRVEHGGVTGYAAAAYVAGSAAGGGDLPAPAPAGATPAPATGRAMVIEASRFRDQPGLGSTIIARVPAGTVVEPTGREVSADGYRWTRVRVYGRDGWIVSGALGAVPGPGTGRLLAAEALSHIGRPYTWGGETPTAGFDCSGLMRYVVQRVTGIDITHVLAYQAQAGSPVERDELQIGDMVFFKDTYKPGLSHVGFYLGDGQFVSAQNERVGVARASLGQAYWSSRYYGARRLSD